MRRSSGAQYVCESAVRIPHLREKQHPIFRTYPHPMCVYGRFRTYVKSNSRLWCNRAALPLPVGIHMHMLRAAAIEAILVQLNRGFLSPPLFETKFNDETGRVIHLTYRDAPNMEFQIVQPLSQVHSGNSWKTVETPGRYFTSQESYTFSDFNGALGAMHGWLDRVAEDVLLQARSHGDTSQFVEFRRRIDEVADHLPEPEVPFSQAEAKEWLTRMDSMVEQLRKLEEDSEFQKGTVERLKNQLDTLLAHAPTIPKKTWLKTAANKVVDVFETGAKAGIKALAEGAAKAFLEHTK